MRTRRSVRPLFQTVLDFLADGLKFVRLTLCPRKALAAEIFFLPKQLALYLERHVKPRRASDVTRVQTLQPSEVEHHARGVGETRP